MKVVDKIGLRFGRLVVIERAGVKSGHSMWKCLCDCGKEKTVMGCSLTSGATKSCGCFKLERVAQNGKKTVKDLSGTRFGRILVIDRNLDRQAVLQVNAAYWNCKCDCGAEAIIRGSNLIRKKKPTQSCGCLAKELTAKRNKNLFSLSNGQSSFNAIFAHYARNAKLRNYEFHLTKKEFRGLSQLKCFYCGEEPSNCLKGRCETGDFIYNGIDRIDNTKGYILDNCVSCCGICNRMKLTMTQYEFKLWIRKAFRHWAQFTG